MPHRLSRNPLRHMAYLKENDLILIPFVIASGAKQSSRALSGLLRSARNDEVSRCLIYLR